MLASPKVWRASSGCKAARDEVSPPVFSLGPRAGHSRVSGPLGTVTSTPLLGQASPLEGAHRGSGEIWNVRPRKSRSFHPLRWGFPKSKQESGSLSCSRPAAVMETDLSEGTRRRVPNGSHGDPQALRALAAFPAVSLHTIGLRIYKLRHWLWRQQ